MELKQYVKLIAILALALSPALVFGYDNSKTHPMLTGEAIKLFEASGQSNFTEAEKNQIVQGAKDEDNVPRWLEHFYDPVNNRGLNGGQFSTSKKWAHGQAITGNDYSWENAIYEYVYGTKNEGLYALGHIMHLVQDATVPDHTRDDPHPITKTYEAYASTQNSVPVASLSYFDSLDDYFDQLANFSNSNFFSDDTILKYYANPKIVKIVSEEGKNGNIDSYGFSNYGRLVLVNKLWGKDGLVYNEYSIVDTDKKIMADYWNTLSPKAVGYSAGVIKLFFTEVEKEKASGALKKARMPWWEKLLEMVKIRVDELLASVNLSIKEAEQNPPPPTPVVITPGLPTPESEKTKQEELIETRDKLEKLKTDLVEVTDKGELAILPVIRSVNTVMSSLGEEPVDIEAPTTTATTTIVTIAPPVIISPSDFLSSFATTSITFSGTASSGLVVFNDFDRGQATTSDSGEWSMAINNLSQGTTTIKFFARDNDGNVSEPTEISLNVDSLPLVLNLSISNCSQSLTSDFCLLKPTSTLSFAWSLTKAGDYKYDLIKTEYDWAGEWYEPEIVSASLLTLEASSNLDFGPDDLFREFKWQVVARDASSSEVVASSSEIITVFHPRPIVINEIGWAGTVASNLDEWFELHNYLTEFPINLADYYLSDKEKTWQINLSGPVPADGYYLAERGSDEVISNRPAQLVDNFVPDVSAKTFATSSVGLKLWHKTSSGDELVDETPVWDKTGSEPSSLERNFENFVSTDLDTWKNNWGCTKKDGPCALDRNATTTFGTPGVINHASKVSIW